MQSMNSFLSAAIHDNLWHSLNSHGDHRELKKALTRFNSRIFIVIPAYSGTMLMLGWTTPHLCRKYISYIVTSDLPLLCLAQTSVILQILHTPSVPQAPAFTQNSTTLSPDNLFTTIGRFYLVERRHRLAADQLDKRQHIRLLSSDHQLSSMLAITTLLSFYFSLLSRLICKKSRRIFSPAGYEIDARLATPLRIRETIFINNAS